MLASLDNVSFALEVLSLDGRSEWRVPLPPFGDCNLTFPPRVTPRSDAFLFGFATFTERLTIYALDPAAHELTVAVPSRGGIDGLVVEQHFATSRDGTRVPYFVVARADLDRTRPHPTLLRAYGGFNLPFTPAYLSEVAPYVRCGGVFVHANLRGGGEYGSSWHEGGRLHNKQNCFDDCYAVAKALIADGVTTAAQLGLQGASNGGLLAAVGAVQRPDLFAACVPQAPLLDMLEPVRPAAGEDAERSRAVFVGDYGDPNDPSDAPVLFAYSPYHNIREGVAYPAVYQQFGENDLGCPPYHGRKFTARLRHCTTSGKPVFLHTWRQGGHGGSHDPLLMARMTAGWLSFVFQQTGLPYRPPHTA